MKANPLSYPDADRSDLARADPNAGRFPVFAIHIRLESVAYSRNSIRSEGLDDGFLELAHVAVQIATALAQIHDGIDDQLIGSMIRSTATTVDIDRWPQPSKNVALARAAATGHDWRMGAKDKSVARQLVVHETYEIHHSAQGERIINESPILGFDRFAHKAEIKQSLERR